MRSCFWKYRLGHCGVGVSQRHLGHLVFRFQASSMNLLKHGDSYRQVNLEMLRLVERMLNWE